MFVFNYIMQIGGPLIGLLGLIGYRSYIHGIIFKKKYKYTEYNL